MYRLNRKNLDFKTNFVIEAIKDCTIHGLYTFFLPSQPLARIAVEDATDPVDGRPAEVKRARESDPVNR